METILPYCGIIWKNNVVPLNLQDGILLWCNQVLNSNFVVSYGDNKDSTYFKLGLTSENVEKNMFDVYKLIILPGHLHGEYENSTFCKNPLRMDLSQCIMVDYCLSCSAVM